MQKTDLIAPLPIGTPIALTGDKTIPPQSATGTDTSSIDVGFLPITSEPLDDGGIAPERLDFNGMFYLSTDQRVFLQNGGFITYDSSVATKIGGYPEGAILGYVSQSGYGFVESLIDNNQYNFVTTPSYIDGINWRFIPLINTLETIKLIYPVGSIYIGTTVICPLASLFGTWELVSEGRVLQGSDENHQAGTTIAAGLPNIKGTFPAIEGNDYLYSGAFYIAQHDVASDVDNSNGDRDDKAGFDASRLSSIYSDDVTTVQPPAYVVNIWRRTA